MADTLEAVVQRMLDAGESEENIATVVRQMSQPPTTGIVSPDEPGTYAGGFLKGMKEGVVGGFKGYVKNQPMDVLRGFGEIAKTPYYLAKSVYDAGVGAVNLAMDPKGVLQQSASDVSNMLKMAPQRVSNYVTEEMRRARTNPEQFGADVSHVTGPIEAGLLTGKAATTLPAPVARVTGNMIANIGDKGHWPLTIAGAHELGSGNPMGIVTMTLPDQMVKWGNALERLGTPAGSALATPKGQYVQMSTDVNSLARSGDEGALARLRAQVEEKNIELNKRLVGKVTERDMDAIVKEQTLLNKIRKQLDATEKNMRDRANAATRAAQIEADKAGLAPGPKTVTETTSATDATGNRSTSKTVYRPEVEDLQGTAGVNVEEELKKLGLSGDRLQKAAQSAGPQRKGSVRLPDEPLKATQTEPTAPTPKTGVEGVRPSRTSREMSATPGLSRNDVLSIGLNPDNPIKALSQKAVDQIMQSRQFRALDYAEQARLEARLKALLASENQ